MEFSVDLINALAKRGWRIVRWVLPLYIFGLLLLLVLTLSDMRLVSDLLHLKSNGFYEWMQFLLGQIFISLIVLFIFYLMKGETRKRIQVLRSDFYSYCRDRAVDLFRFRFRERTQEEGELETLFRYPNRYRLGERMHTVDARYLYFREVPEVDSAYFIYEVGEDPKKERVVYSLWHNGRKLCMAVAFDRRHYHGEEKRDQDILDRVEERFQKALNLDGAKTHLVQMRGTLIWFDVIYEVSEDFLINGVEQEYHSRHVAHILTLGLPVALELMGWKRVE